jgi:hypothetical protein
MNSAKRNNVARSVALLAAVLPFAAGAARPLAAASPAMAQAERVSAPPRITATVKPNPPRVGDNEIEFIATDEQGKPVTGLSLAARVEMTNMDMGVTRPAVKETGNGHYRATVTFSMAGPWRVGLRGRGEGVGPFAATVDLEAGGKKSVGPLRVTVNRAEPAPAADTHPTAEGGASHAAHMTSAKMPQLPLAREVTVTGRENWKVRTGFGKNAGVVAMMNGMMVEGTGLDKMKMGAVKMDFGAANFTEDEDDAPTASAPAPPGAETGKPAAPAAGGEAAANPAPLPAHPEAAPTAPEPAPVAPEAKPAPPAPAENGAGAGKAAHPTPPAAGPLKITARLDAKAARVGDNRVLITVLDVAGKPVIGAKVTASVAMTNMDMGTTKPAVKELGKGVYATTAGFTMAGPWRVTVRVVPAPGQKPQTQAVDVTAK